MTEQEFKVLVKEQMKPVISAYRELRKMPENEKLFLSVDTVTEDNETVFSVSGRSGLKNITWNDGAGNGQG